MAYAAGPGEGAADLQEGKKSRDGESKEDNMKCKMQERKWKHFGHDKIPYYLLTLLTTSSPLLFFFFFNIRTSIFSVCYLHIFRST